MNRKYFIACLPALVFLFAFRLEPSRVGGSLLWSVSEALAGEGEEPSATDSILHQWLSPQVVNNNKPVANTFYFWTSTEELDSCLSQGQLLRTSAPSNPAESIYWNKMPGTIEHPEAISNHLRSGERQRVRAAWPCYWGLLSESFPQSSENQLVQVVLMDSSLIVAFHPDERKNKWTIFDLHGNSIPMNVALERKRHIAAVFIEARNKVVMMHIHRHVINEYCRSFILCNESMIKSWHHGVPGMQAKIVQDLDYLLLMNAYLGEGLHGQMQGRKGSNCTATWVMPAAKMRVSQMLFATQRFAWDSGKPATQSTSTAIIDLLRERWPRQVKPCERFPARK
jgi:hypothetical protein